jgi:hypothetical protein
METDTTVVRRIHDRAGLPSQMVGRPLDLCGVLLAAFSVFSSIDAHADVGPPIESCTTVDAMPNMPNAASLNALRQRHRMPTLIRCDYNEATQTPSDYFIATGVVRSAKRVCSYRRKAVTLSGSVWLTSREAETAYFLAEPTAKCPLLGDLRYVLSWNVTPSEFLWLATFWHDASSSPQRFDALIPSSSEATSLRREMFEVPSSVRRFALGSVSRSQAPHNYLRCYFTSCFEMWISDGELTFHSITIAMPYWGGDVVVLAVDRNVL